MKKTLTILFLLYHPEILFCQGTLFTSPIFQLVEEMPMFPGGRDRLMEFIGKNIQYPLKQLKGSFRESICIICSGYCWIDTRFEDPERCCIAERGSIEYSESNAAIETRQAKWMECVRPI